MKLDKSQFKKISSKKVYTSKKVAVIEDKIELPNGNTVFWDYYDLPNLFYGIVLSKDFKKVFLVREYRSGPSECIVNFTGARDLKNNQVNGIKELKRELEEEMGVVPLRLEFLMKIMNGTHIGGFKFFYLVIDYKKSILNPDKNELLEIIDLPVKGLYKRLVSDFIAPAEVLLMAKILEERFSE